MSFKIDSVAAAACALRPIPTQIGQTVAHSLTNNESDQMHWYFCPDAAAPRVYFKNNVSIQGLSWCRCFKTTFDAVSLSSLRVQDDILITHLSRGK